MVVLTAEKKSGAASGRAAPPPPPRTPARQRPSPRTTGRPRGRRAGRRQGRCAWRRRHRRGGERQGRRREIDDRGQPRPRAQGQRSPRRHPRRRHLRPVAAAPPQPQGKAAGGERPYPPPARRLRHQGDVDRPPRRGGDADDLARADGDLGADPDAPRGRVGRARHPRRRHAARHRRRAAHHGAAGAARRRGNRLDAAGPGADRRAEGPQHVQAGRRAGARHRREHELLRLSALRRPHRHLRPWRGAPRGRAARRAIPRRGAARPRHPRSPPTPGSRSSSPTRTARTPRSIARSRRGSGTACCGSAPRAAGRRRAS